MAVMTMAVSQAFGHAYWVETSTTGKKGQAQEVRVFFGEYADKDITPLAKWFSDTKDYSLIVITPDKQEIKLQSVPGSDHYKATFTPTADGVYTVVLKHSVKDVYHGSRLDYHSSAVVRVGNSSAGDSNTVNPNNISVYSAAKSYKANDNISVQALLDKAGKKSKEVEVVAPNGWGKKLYTDSTGTVNFTPIWPGRYMVEVAETQEQSGDHHGKPFQKIWRCATYCIEVAK